MYAHKVVFKPAKGGKGKVCVVVVGVVGWGGGGRWCGWFTPVLKCSGRWQKGNVPTRSCAWGPSPAKFLFQPAHVKSIRLTTFTAMRGGVRDHQPRHHHRRPSHRRVRQRRLSSPPPITHHPIHYCEVPHHKVIPTTVHTRCALLLLPTNASALYGVMSMNNRRCEKA